MYRDLDSSPYYRRSLTWSEKKLDQALGIIVHLFCVLLEVNQLAGGDFTICDNHLLYHNEEGTEKFYTCLVYHSRDVTFFG